MIGEPLLLGKVTLSKVIHACSTFPSFCHGIMVGGGTLRRESLTEYRYLGTLSNWHKLKLNCVCGSQAIPSYPSLITYSIPVLFGFASVTHLWVKD